MDIEIRPSARRHGISDERIRYVIAHAAQPLDPPVEPGVAADVVVYLGLDQYGIGLEIAAVELPDGGLRIVHAMKMRSKYRDDYRRLIGWSE